MSSNSGIESLNGAYCTSRTTNTCLTRPPKNLAHFFGNVQVGPQTPPAIPHSLPISLSSLKSHYAHLLFSTGCAIPTLHPTLSPSDCIIPALSLIHWYTQYPSRPFPPPLQETEHVSIIGQGDVALDVAPCRLPPLQLPRNVRYSRARTRRPPPLRRALRLHHRPAQTLPSRPHHQRAA